MELHILDNTFSDPKLCEELHILQDQFGPPKYCGIPSAPQNLKWLAPQKLVLVEIIDGH